MPTVIYHTPDGEIQRIEGRLGASVMETARAHGVPGIVAECGGGLACATCHVFVDPGWIARTGPAEDFEDEMLDDAATPRQENSRLSCQIRLTEDLDGLVVRVAPEQ